MTASSVEQKCARSNSPAPTGLAGPLAKGVKALDWMRKNDRWLVPFAGLAEDAGGLIVSLESGPLHSALGFGGFHERIPDEASAEVFGH